MKTFDKEKFVQALRKDIRDASKLWAFITALKDEHPDLYDLAKIVACGKCGVLLEEWAIHLDLAENILLERNKLLLTKLVKWRVGNRNTGAKIDLLNYEETRQMEFCRSIFDFHLALTINLEDDMVENIYRNVDPEFFQSQASFGNTIHNSVFEFREGLPD